MRGCLVLLIGIIIGATAVWLLWAQSSPPVQRGVVVPQHADLHVVLSNHYLTHLVNAQLPGSTLVTVHHVQISSSPPDTLDTQAQVSAGPLSVPVSAAVVPSVQSGAVHIALVSTHVGIVPIPSAFTGLLESTINNGVRQSVGRSVQVVGVDVRPQGLEVYANYR
jgi:hypothetical protein